MKNFRQTLTSLAAVTVLAVALVAPSCVIVRPPRAGVKAGKCPPGHVWSDGRCHNKGKGHDPAKHEKKKKDKKHKT